MPSFNFNAQVHLKLARYNKRMQTDPAKAGPPIRALYGKYSGALDNQ